MTRREGAGRAWSDDVAHRPGGYAVTWTQTVEGPDAQTLFDTRVSELTPSMNMLDLGCGDGASTLTVAKHARHVPGVDFSEGMLANARRAAEAPGMEKVTFVHAHAREDAGLTRAAFDVAYTRRGPNITVVVPALVRAGGVLLGLHPLEQDADQERYAGACATPA